MVAGCQTRFLPNTLEQGIGEFPVLLEKFELLFYFLMISLKYMKSSLSEADRHDLQSRTEG